MSDTTAAQAAAVDAAEKFTDTKAIDARLAELATVTEASVRETMALIAQKKKLESS